jgi:hypothetical protein
MTTRRWVGWAAFAVLCTAGCGHATEVSPEVPSDAVVVLEGNSIPVSAFEAYVDSILSLDAEDEPLPSEDLDRVRSRLFDAFVDEEILLFEARRRGVVIPDSEIDAYLGAAEADTEATVPAPATDSARRAARRNLTIQKLRGAVVLVESTIGNDELDAYIAEHRAELLADQPIVLRSLTAGTRADAARIRDDLASGKTSFAETIQALGLGSDQGQPMEVGLSDLPDEIRDAVSGLTSGQISEPVAFQGSIYLFLVEVGPVAPGEPQLREKAMAELSQIKSQEASDRFLERLRSEVAVEIHREALPFTYVPEEEEVGEGADPVLRPGE